MNLLTTKILGAAVAVVMALPASAATFDFMDGSLGGNGGYTSGYSATVDGVTVDVTAGRYRSNWRDDSIVDADCADGGCGGWSNRIVTKNDNGLGIGAGAGGLDLLSQVDGFFGNDLITFTFDSVVDFGSIFFTDVDGNDDFDLFVDGALVSEDVNIASSNPFFGTLSGTSFSFGADGSFDNFRVGGISVNIAAVPLPATGLLLLAGLGGLGFARRRKG